MVHSAVSRNIRRGAAELRRRSMGEPPMNHPARRAVAIVLAAALGLAACSSGATDDGADGTAPTGGGDGSTTLVAEGPAAPPVTGPADFEGQGSVEQAYLVGAEPGQDVILADR